MKSSGMKLAGKIGTFALLALVLCGAMVAPQVRAHSGHTDWGPWRFDWEVRDSAGLGVANVYYNNELVLYKGNMPVIRVRYDQNSCGPYADRIDWDNLLQISNCGYNKVCQKSYNSGGRTWLEIGVLAGIGKYRIYNVWYFSTDGYIHPRMWSRGLHCIEDHQHHTYLRLDFDVNGASSDQVFVFNNNVGNEGWGPGWHKYTQELNTTKNPGTARVWFVRDNPTGHGIWIMPSGNDGSTDSFSTKDAAPRLYHAPVEGVPWPFGAGQFNGTGGHLGYQNSENISEKDVVFWYISHLNHEEELGPNEWKWAGPWLKVSR